MSAYELSITINHWSRSLRNSLFLSVKYFSTKVNKIPFAWNLISLSQNLRFSFIIPGMQNNRIVFYWLECIWKSIALFVSNLVFSDKVFTRFLFISYSEKEIYLGNCKKDLIDRVRVTSQAFWVMFFLI